MFSFNHDIRQRNRRNILGNLILIGIIALFVIIIIASLLEMNRPISTLPSQNSLAKVSHTNDFLSISHLVYYSMRTMFRMIIGMLWSFLFSIIFGVLAARYKTARRIILPLVNFLESVPLLGFLTFTTAWLLGLFPGNVLGVEALAIFAVFTGQVWNIVLTLYQTMEVVPDDLLDVVTQFKCSAWEKFWRLEFVYSIPGLLWNVVISQTAAWFALVASEQATVAIPRNTTLILPGIGSYIQIALDRADYKACIWAVLALLINILILNFLIFQPLIKASFYFKYDNGTGKSQPPKSIIYDLVQPSTLGQFCLKIINQFKNWWLYSLPRIWYILKLNIIFKYLNKITPFLVTLWYVGLTIVGIWSVIKLYAFLPHQDFAIIPKLTYYTTLRVALAMIISGVIFIPLAVWVADNTRRLSWIQPIGQVIGSIPSNVYTPLIVIFITLGHNQLEWWVLPLIMVGCQWYFFFNVIGGYLAIPTDIKDVTHIFKITKWRWWTQYLIPSILPYIITAIINAAGAAWNADIAAESIQWGAHKIEVTGLGQYIATNNGIQNKSALGTLAMCFVVGLCIAFIWQPLYKFAREKYHY